jgi:hypothetical protein
MATPAEIFRYFEFAEEDTRGIAETTPEMSCDAMELDPGIPKNPEMEYKGSMGRGKTLHRPGPYSCSPSGTIGTDIKILARMLYFTLGNQRTETVEGTGATLPADSVWYYDASGTSFATEKTDFNSDTATDVNVPGHAAGEVGDYIAIGMEDPFNELTINTGTAKTDVSTIVWEYWDGSAWVAFPSPGVTDGTTGFTVSGSQVVTFTEPTDWVAKKLSTDTQEYYYIRARCSAFTSATAQGKITQGFIGMTADVATQYIYSGNNILLPSFTSFMGVDTIEHQISGCVINKMELAAEDDFLTLKFDMFGQTPTTSAIKAYEDLSLNDDYPLAFYEVNLHMRELGSTTPWGAATKISEDVKKLKTSIDNGVSDKDGLRLGSRFPGFLPAGERTPSMTFDYLYLDNQFIEMLWGSADGPLERTGSTEVEMMVEIDAGLYGNVEIWFPRVIVTGSPLKSKGRDPIIQDITVDAYQAAVTIPTTPTVDVYTDCLSTFNLNFPDTTGSFDGPAWAGDNPP